MAAATVSVQRDTELAELTLASLLQAAPSSSRSHILLLLPLMTICHKAGHYCHI